MSTIARLIGKQDSFAQLQSLFGASLPPQPKLHLGCGEVRLENYINIDFPPSEHTVQKKAAADVYANITQLCFKPEQISEIRLHHVFEHFDRPTALALLAAWHQWLTPQGELIIETPDLERSIDLLRNPQHSFQEKQIVLRHLFGSHEASWAVHYDGWYEEKYRWALSALGYEILKVEHSEWKMTRNITVQARRGASLSNADIAARAKKLLRSSMVDNAASEESLWQQWCSQFDGVFETCCSTQKHPKVSIFIPAYNREQYLPQTLDSLLSQTFTDFEIIIADDGSTDNTMAIAQAYATKDSRIKVLALQHSGEVETRNAAIAQTSPHSKYLLNHDSDDVSLPTKLETLVNFLDANPHISIVGCRAAYFDDLGNNLGIPPIELAPDKIRATFGQANSMINSASLIRREVFTRLGGYREEFRSVDDYDFFARALLAKFELANVPDILHLIRIHPQSVGSTRAQLQEQLASQVRAHYEANR